jgi:hypothetical protein
LSERARVSFIRGVTVLGSITLIGLAAGVLDLVVARAAEGTAAAPTVAETSRASQGHQLFRKSFTLEEGLGPEFLHHELGIETLPRSRREISEVDVAALTAFVRALPSPRTPASDEGVEVFKRALCATCHALVTGTAIVAGAPVEVRAFTDLLLHEMGDGPRHRERDSRTEFRTPAL